MRTLTTLIVTVSLTSVARPQPTGDDPRELIRRAIEAHGGPDRLDRLRQVREQTAGTLHLLRDKSPFNSETVQRLPGQFRHTLVSEVGGKKLHIVATYDGKQGWLTEGEVSRPVDEKTLAGWKVVSH